MISSVIPTFAASKPHIISILEDDLGWYDSGIHNPTAAAWSGNITALAKQGIILTNHYSHWHCSPSRRSFLTGRLPIHHGEQLSGDNTDDIDLRMTWVSDKLQQAGYKAHMFGKWHTGFRSMHHLPTGNGFSSAVGSFQTGGNYQGPKHTMRWQNDHPIWADSQITDEPASCNTSYYNNIESKETWTCKTSNFLLKTELPCGSAITKKNTSTAMECCGACSNQVGCTHWVYDPDSTKLGTCHIKSGDADCAKTKKGATSGLTSQTGASCANEYSTDLWGQMALQALSEHDPHADGPIYIHLCFQAVHSPYDPVPDWSGNTYEGMLWRADLYVGQLVTLLKNKGMYDNTLIVYSADNGGVNLGNNYPLRGEKHSNWEGGMKVASFVSGGLIPQKLRGTSNGVNMHLVDWYATFAKLAGVDPTDNPPEPPLPVDPSQPLKNIYGNKSFPAVDGVDVWPMLMDPSSYSIDAAHKYLVLSKEVVIAGKYKLLVSQPHFKSQELGWKQPDGTWRKPNATEQVSCMTQDVAPHVSALPVPGTPGALPCLFDLRSDPGEHHDLAADNVQLVHELWKTLNNTILTQRDCNGWSYKGTSAVIPGPVQPDGTTSCSSPEKLGNCNKTCANNKWKSYGSNKGPICGVPGCS